MMHIQTWWSQLTSLATENIKDKKSCVAKTQDWLLSPHDYLLRWKQRDISC